MLLAQVISLLTYSSSWRAPGWKVASYAPPLFSSACPTGMLLLLPLCLERAPFLKQRHIQHAQEALVMGALGTLCLLFWLLDPGTHLPQHLQVPCTSMCFLNGFTFEVVKLCMHARRNISMIGWLAPNLRFQTGCACREGRTARLCNMGMGRWHGDPKQGSNH